MRGVIFGCEGVLVDTTALGRAAWEAVAKEWAVEPPPTDAALRGLVGRRPADVLPAFVAEWFPHRDVAEAVRTRAAHYFRLARAAGLAAPPAGAGLVADVRARGRPVACASPNPLDLLLFHLHETGLLEEFEVCVGGDEVAEGPPAPDLLLEAARRLAVPPDRCLVVEASPVGIQGARAAGMTVVGVAGAFPASALGAAHRVIASPGDVTPPVLDRYLSES